MYASKLILKMHAILNSLKKNGKKKYVKQNYNQKGTSL